MKKRPYAWWIQNTSSGLLKVSAIILEKPMWKSSGTLGKFVWIKQIGMSAANNNDVYQSKKVITAINTNTQENNDFLILFQVYFTHTTTHSQTLLVMFMLQGQGQKHSRP